MSERLDDRVTAAVGVILTVDSKREPCMTRNVSRGGMFVLTKMPLAAGREVHVEVVHDGKRFSSKARVTTITAQGAGLQFVAAGGDFLAGMEGLIRALLKKPGGGENSDVGEPVDLGGTIGWSHLPDGKSWNWWKKGQIEAELVSLSLDGAALACKKRPQIAETVIIYLSATGGQDGGPNTCRAEVVRLTDRGFAVKFSSPSLEFRRAVTRMRRGG